MLDPDDIINYELCFPGAVTREPPGVPDPTAHDIVVYRIVKDHSGRPVAIGRAETRWFTSL